MKSPQFRNFWILLNIAGSIVTADAMSCQKNIVQKIRDNEADYAAGHIDNYQTSPNLNVLRKTALALCKHADFSSRVSMKKKRFAAALDPDHFLKILSAKL